MRMEEEQNRQALIDRLENPSMMDRMKESALDHLEDKQKKYALEQSNQMSGGGLMQKMEQEMLKRVDN